MGKVNQIERAGRAWNILTDLANGKHLDLTYQDLGVKLGIHHRAVQFVLGVIIEYTEENNSPPLTALVVNKNSREPGRGFIEAFAGNAKSAKQQVYEFDWKIVGNPFSDINGLGRPDEVVRKILDDPRGEGSILSRVKSRGIAQRLFREALLKAYGTRCCICELGVSYALEAAHIIPWNKSDENQKSAVTNGLLLCASHHRLYDAKCVGVASNYVVTCDFDVDGAGADDLNNWYLRFAKSKISLPSEDNWRPDPGFLAIRHEDDGW